MVEEFLMRAQNSRLSRLSHNAGHRLVKVLAKQLLKIFLLVNSCVENLLVGWHEEAHLRVAGRKSVCFTAQLLVSTFQRASRSTYLVCWCYSSSLCIKSLQSEFYLQQ
jgi:hypothetical protein